MLYFGRCEEVLQVRDIECGYGSRPVLNGVSLEAQPGDMVGIIGPNGCGKTTLLRVICGVLRPWRGQVMLDGQDCRRFTPRQLAQQMAVVTQESLTDLAFDVREIVLMGRTPHIGHLGWETKHDLDVAQRAMEYLDVAHLADRPITEISSGERQRVFIAMALAQEPRILLLDEATSHLDIDHQVAILDLIRRRNREEGLTVLLVSHDLNLAAEYCEKLVFMHEGRVVAAGAPEQVLTAENIRRVYRAQVHLQASPITGRPHILLIPEGAMNSSKKHPSAGCGGE